MYAGAVRHRPAAAWAVCAVYTCYNMLYTMSLCTWPACCHHLHTSCRPTCPCITTCHANARTACILSRGHSHSGPLPVLPKHIAACITCTQCKRAICAATTHARAPTLACPHQPVACVSQHTTKRAGRLCSHCRCDTQTMTAGNTHMCFYSSVAPPDVT